MHDVSMVHRRPHYPSHAGSSDTRTSSLLPLVDDSAMADPALDPSPLLRMPASSQPPSHQFLRVAPEFCTQVTRSYEASPLLNLYPPKVTPGHTKTPVMHPNLVCTLKSILSPQISLGLEDRVPSRGDSLGSGRSGLLGFSQHSEIQGSGQGDSPLAHCTGQASPGGPLWPTGKNSNQVLGSGRKQLPQAVLVSVDLIQNRRPYHCAFIGCERTFKNPQTMKMHHKTHFSDATAARLEAEALSAIMPGSCLRAGHNKKIPSRCPACHKTFVGLYELRRHFGRKHSEGEKSHACRKCGKKFHIEVDVRDHEKLCGEPIVCACGMKFAFKCNLVAHKRSHPKCQDRAAMEEENWVNTNPQESSSDSQVHDGQSKQASMEVTVQSPTHISRDLRPTRHQLPPLQPLSLFDSASSSLPLRPRTSSLSAPTMQPHPKNRPTCGSKSLTLDSHYSALVSGALQSASSMGYPFDE